eukprot:TRINITY_DN3502_c0_g1_i1.p1 TRINITY_DN3502_c0_g1~~TRINITY_DN3502_c0_g1_i1.p1  ORF type:complete len:1176 (+),score=281.93 TRINITY_DN3502_c0_g1_i1:32-3559(+)
MGDVNNLGSRSGSKGNLEKLSSHGGSQIELKQFLETFEKEGACSESDSESEVRSREGAPSDGDKKVHSSTDKKRDPLKERIPTKRDSKRKKKEGGSSGKNRKKETLKSDGFSSSESVSSPSIPYEYDKQTDPEKIKFLEAKIQFLEVENRSLKEELAKYKMRVASLEIQMNGKEKSNADGTSDDVVVILPHEKRNLRKDTGLITFDLATLARTKLPSFMKKPDITTRQRIAGEILTTEQSYVLGLEILVKAYQYPLLSLAKKENKFSEEEIVKIFQNTETLLRINSTLCDELENRLLEWDSKGVDTIGDIFKSWAPKLKPYCRYAQFYEESMQALESKKDIASFRRAMEELEQVVWNFNQQNFRDLFITPVQRVPRYCLLLRDLIRETPSDHADYADLNVAITEMEKMASEVNEKIRSSETEVHLFMLLERGGGFERMLKNPPPYLGNQRKWQKEGEVLAVYDLRDIKKGNSFLPGSKKKAELFLFSDIIVAGNFVGKKIAAQDYHQPLHLLWVSQQVTEDVKKQLEGLEKETLNALLENILLIKGPEMHWAIGFSQDKSHERVTWYDAIISRLPGLSRESPKDELEFGVREGTYEFKTKGIYEGEWKAGYPHGVGELVTPDGWIFSGYWDSRFRAGFGVVTKPDGQTFEHGWRDTPDAVKLADYNVWSTEELNELDWQILLTGAQIVKLTPGNRFIEQGKLNTKLFRLKSGKIRIEKSMTPDGPKKILGIKEPPVVVGDTAVISSLSSATADCLAHTEIELEAIAVDILFGIFKSDPALSMKFFRQTAVKISQQLRAFHGGSNDNKQSEKSEKSSASNIEESDTNSEVESDESESNEGQKDVPKKEKRLTKSLVNVPTFDRSSSIRSSSSPSSSSLVVNEKEEAAKRFRLPTSEVLIKYADCFIKTVVKQAGKIYLFQEHVCFESSIFGMSTQEVFPMNQITNIELHKKKVLKLEASKGKKFSFSGIKEVDNLSSLMIRLWEERRKVETQKPGTQSAKSKVLGVSAIKPNKEEITMTSADWVMLLKGAELKSYKDGQVIVEEGKEQTRIYQVARGRCVVKKNGVVLGHLDQNHLFGEMAFLDKNMKLATASVIAEGEDVFVHQIDSFLINIVFVHNPALAGRFYSYLATILAKRLSDREAKVAAETAEKSKKKSSKKSGSDSSSSSNRTSNKIL